MNLRNVPIQRKLTTIILLTSGVGVLLACAAFITYESITFRKTLFSEVQTMADVISANSITALLFNDPKAATETLSTLKADRNILLGALYDANGKLFARYPASEGASAFPTEPSTSHYFQSGQLILFYPVTKDEGQLGVLYLKTDLAPLYQRRKLYAGIVALVMVVSILGALLTARWLQSSITKPITELSETARAVSDQKNYLVRADKYGNDEIGKLTEAFNHMLAQIHERDLALLANQERLKLALSASQTGTWDWDVKTNRITWDDFTHLLYGLRPGTFGGNYESFINLVHPQDRMAVSAAVEETLKVGREFNVEFQVIWPDGTAHQIASRGKAIYDEAQNAVRMSGVCLDITERKRQEEEIRLLNLELEQRVLLRTAELTASIREMETFTYSVSHDLRAPLRHIIAFTEILQDEFQPKLDATAQDYLSRIVHGARNMSQLVDDLLNLARIGRQGINRQRTNLNNLVQEAMVDLTSETGTRKIEWKINPLPELECDPGLIRQVFVNLLSNAVKYSRPRDVAVIEIGEMELKGKKTIFVRDNGVGFNMKYADKLFGVFQRLHRAEDFEGTGVGLATVERIIHKHGGRVWAESEVDKGTTFYFTIEKTDGAGKASDTTSFFRAASSSERTSFKPPAG